MSATVPVDAVADLPAWRVINAMANSLTKAFQDEAFAFDGKVLNGVPQQEERWKRVQAATDRVARRGAGPALCAPSLQPRGQGQDARAGRKPPRGAQGTDREARLDGSGDQGPGAQEARRLRRQGRVIPTSGATTRRSTITRSPTPENLLRAQRFETARNLAKLGKPIDRTEWGMTTPTVNAYYSPRMNEIVFPAGILQPPFFDPKADDAVNYGGIGAVIGHEMGHGFDDSGSQFDADGNLKNWWTEADRAAFKAQHRPDREAVRRLRSRCPASTSTAS